MTSRAVVGVDVGGTSIKALLVADDGTVQGEHRSPTPPHDPTGERVCAAVVDAVGHLCGDSDLRDAVGVVVPGIVDERSGVAVYSANLGWRDLPLRDRLREYLGPRTAFGHDVRAGALAEARWGAAASTDGVVAFVPIGTGIAAALLVDGVPVASDGWAGEIGQQLIGSGPHAGRRVEEIASAAGIAAAAGAPDARTVAAQVAAGEPLASEVWHGALTVLADALAGLSVVVAPRTIVIGGGLALAGATLFDPLSALLHDRLPHVRVPRLVAAELGDRAAARGAAALALEMAVSR